MRVENHILSEKEELRVLEIYHRFKQTFKKCKILKRKNMIGIGEVGKQLMCYFTYCNPIILIKFKDIERSFDIFDNSIDENVDKTIELFQKNDFSLKNSAKTSRTFKSQQSKYLDLPIDSVKNEFEKLKLKIGEELNQITFDDCSARLKNAFYKNGIYNIGAMRLLSSGQILRFKNFGSKCLWELCEFLSNLIDTQKDENDGATVLPPPCKNEAVSRQAEMITFIEKISKKTLVCDITNSVDKYLKNAEKYGQIYTDLIEFLSKAPLYKLTPREQAIFRARFGINEEPKTLQEIGDLHSITRERVRQILVKAIKKLNNKRMPSLEYLQLEYQKCQLIEDIEQISTSGFLAYIYFESNNIELLKLVYFMLFKEQIELSYIKNELGKQYALYKKQEIIDKKHAKYNESIVKLITFGRKKKISDEAFYRLESERSVNTKDEALLNFSYEYSTYQCESFLEKKILENLLQHNTFKKIKTQSLKIPFNGTYYYPDFQCLTHDNYFVLIEVKPMFNMCEEYNIKKFHAMKNYCEKYGFGYLIVDDKNNSFFEIDEPNAEFNSLILSELKNNSNIPYSKYKEIYNNSKATIKNLLTLIKTENLKLSFPFRLTY